MRPTVQQCRVEGGRERPPVVRCRETQGGGRARTVCLLTPAGSSAGPLCEQHVGVWERHVPRQPLRAVLLPARLRPHADGHRSGPPPGEAPPPAPALLTRALRTVLQPIYF